MPKNRKKKKTFNMNKFLHTLLKHLKNIYCILKVIKDIFGLFQKQKKQAFAVPVFFDNIRYLVF